MKYQALVVVCLLCATIAQARSYTLRMEATAFSIRGTTAAGTVTHRGTAAADPAVVPLGSRILVRGAGAYSGYYLVTDTGNAVRGRTIDLFISNPAAAKQFGRKMVTVRILRPSRRAHPVAIAAR
jgi:3D (Asp-Asp-Asp) domain-containing protein